MEKDTMFTHSFNKYILSTCYVQAIVLIVEGINRHGSCLQVDYTLVEKTATSEISACFYNEDRL